MARLGRAAGLRSESASGLEEHRPGPLPSHGPESSALEVIKTYRSRQERDSVSQILGPGTVIVI